MTQTIQDLWNGNIAPVEHCGSHDALANQLIAKIEGNREQLYACLSKTQKEAFQRYMAYSEEYLLRMLELAFCDGFELGSKFMIEILL